MTEEEFERLSNLRQDFICLNYESIDNIQIKNGKFVKLEKKFIKYLYDIIDEDIRQDLRSGDIKPNEIITYRESYFKDLYKEANDYER